MRALRQDAPPPIPPSTDPADAICESSVVVDADAGVRACASCPSYTTGLDERLELSDVHFGHWSSLEVTEAIVSLRGCMGGVSGYGGVAILRWGDRGWRRVAFEEVPLGQCVAFRALDKVGRLLCESRSMHQGLIEGWLEVVTVEGDALRRESFFSLSSHAGGASADGGWCVDFAFGPPEIQENEAGLSLSITVRAGRKRAPRGEPCGPLVAMPSWQLDYDFNGATFRIAPGRRAALRSLMALQSQR